MPLLRPRVMRTDKPGPGRTMVAPANQDPLLTAIVKWIPVEVLTIYKTVDGVIPADQGHFRVWFAAGSILICALWIAFATKPDDKPIAWRQVILAPLAFTCWVVAMQGSALRQIAPGWESWMGSIVLGAGTLLLPIMEGILRALGVRQN